MMKKSSLLVKVSRLMMLLAMVSLVVFQACKDDDDDDDNNNTPAVDPYSGFYKFTSASFVNTDTIIIGQDTTIYQPGDDASIYVATGLLGLAPCQDQDNAALELRSNFESFYACLNETNSLKQGTWGVSPDRTVLTLNITNPAPFSVIINDVTLQNNVLTGIIANLPIVSGVTYKFVTVNTTFNKVP